MITENKEKSRVCDLVTVVIDPLDVMTRNRKSHGPQSQSSAPVTAAAEWLAGEADPPRHAVPALKARFGLSALQACEAIRAAQDMRTGRTAKEKRQ